MRLLLLLIIINTIIAVGCLIWGMLKTKENDRCRKTKYILLSVVIFLCPGVGICFFAFSRFLQVFLFKQDVDMEDVSFKRNKVKEYVLADFDRDTNMVPMQEALLVSNVKRRRKMVLDVLKRDLRKSLGAIAIALDNPDSETAHYAAAVVADAIAEFRGTVQNVFENLKKDPENYEVGILLLDYIFDILPQNILDGEEKRSYIYTADEVGDILYRYHPEKIEGAQYRKLIERMVEIKDYATAEKWANRAKENRDYQLDTYIGCLKLYYSYGDRDAFFQCLDYLKKSNIVINKEIMELIRIFEGKKMKSEE